MKLVKIRDKYINVDTIMYIEERNSSSLTKRYTIIHYPGGERAETNQIRVNDKIENVIKKLEG